jgi:hypothetical protein
MDKQSMQPFDVTPKEYRAERYGEELSENTVRSLFEDLRKHGYVQRAGRPTKRYPEGKLLFMSRPFFNELLAGRATLPKYEAND